METLVKAEWFDLTVMGFFIASGWYLGNEMVRVAWKLVWDALQRGWSLIKPD